MASSSARLLLTVAALLCALGISAIWLTREISWGLTGRHEGPGTITGPTVPRPIVEGREATRRDTAATLGAPNDRQILFGDLHVHTTFSTDAFATSLPVMGGIGTNPPANACDFARYCSALDFWSINDHASNLTPAHWQETKESIRECNSRAGSPDNPDVVAFLGWEWTQVGRTPETHWGHKNVVLLETADDVVPERPISEEQGLAVGGWAGPGALALLDRNSPWQRYFDFARYLRERDEVPICDPSVDTSQLPADCREIAATPADLFRKLREWGGDAIVIPHGTSWGFYTPPGSKWDKQLSERQDDADLQILFELYSGHGNSEQYRSWRAIETGADGGAICPEPRPDYEPSCHRAGEIMRGRCLEQGRTATDCDEVSARTRQLYVENGARGFQVVPGQQPDDWLDSGQCRDCFLPAFNLRPTNSGQYVTAISNFDDGAAPRRARFGFIAASDGHKAKPGIGYKQQNRALFADGMQFQNRRAQETILGRGGDRSAADPIAPKQSGGFGTFEIERTVATMSIGGLTAVHATGRDRKAIWDAMQRKEVYGTSGPKILLWFDLQNPPDGVATLPMGSVVALGETPRFRVRAAGSFRQKPGCPAFADAALGSDRLAELCANQCDHPSDQRVQITRIEVIRIRPQMRPDEPVTPLIEDPWRVIECPIDAAGCDVTFEDPDHASSGRDSVYYVRAIEEPGLLVNAGAPRCTFSESADGQRECVAINACFGVDPSDDCLGEGEARAWSSPIYIDQPRRER